MFLIKFCHLHNHLIVVLPHWCDTHQNVEGSPYYSWLQQTWEALYLFQYLKDPLITLGLLPASSKLLQFSQFKKTYNSILLWGPGDWMMSMNFLLTYCKDSHAPPSIICLFFSFFFSFFVIYKFFKKSQFLCTKCSLTSKISKFVLWLGDAFYYPRME